LQFQKTTPLFHGCIQPIAFVYIFYGILVARRPTTTWARDAKSQSFLCTIQSFCFIRLFSIVFSSLSSLTLGPICSYCVTKDWSTSHVGVAKVFHHDFVHQIDLPGMISHLSQRLQYICFVSQYRLLTKACHDAYIYHSEHLWDRSFVSSEHANIRAAEDQGFPPKWTYLSTSSVLTYLSFLQKWIKGQ
jgi:hypothetical protein